MGRVSGLQPAQVFGDGRVLAGGIEIFGKMLAADGLLEEGLVDLLEDGE